MGDVYAWPALLSAKRIEQIYSEHQRVVNNQKDKGSPQGVLAQTPRNTHVLVGSSPPSGHSPSLSNPWNPPFLQRTSKNNGEIYWRTALSSSIFAHKWHERNDKPGSVQLGCPGFGGCGFTTGWKILVKTKPRSSKGVNQIGRKNHSASFSCVSSHGKCPMRRVYLYFTVLVWSKLCALFHFLYLPVLTVCSESCRGRGPKDGHCWDRCCASIFHCSFQRLHLVCSQPCNYPLVI